MRIVSEAQTLLFPANMPVGQAAWRKWPSWRAVLCRAGGITHPASRLVSIQGKVKLLLLLHTQTSLLECWSTMRGRDLWLLSDW